MFKVFILKVSLGADFTENGVIIIDMAMKAMGVFDPFEKVTLNTFRASIFFAVFANDFFTENGGVVVQTKRTGLGFFLLRLLRSHDGEG